MSVDWLRTYLVLGLGCNGEILKSISFGQDWLDISDALLNRFKQTYRIEHTNDDFSNPEWPGRYYLLFKGDGTSFDYSIGIISKRKLTTVEFYQAPGSKIQYLGMSFTDCSKNWMIRLENLTKQLQWINLSK